MEVNVHRTTLTNGVRVLLDSSKKFHCVSVAVCFQGGSRDESCETSGLTHLLEHLLFKRTKRTDSKRIAERVDEFGGDVNAFTDSNTLCLHGVVPGSKLEHLISFFSELCFESSFTDSDLALEREVVRQEILEANDDPGDMVFRVFCEHFWPNSAFAFPVFGCEENLRKFSVDQLKSRLQELRVGKRIVVAVAGSVEPDPLNQLVEKYFGDVEPGREVQHTVARSSCGVHFVQRSVNQVHLLLGRQWPSSIHEDYIKGLIFSLALGEGMSSRLFQLLREERGLAYDVGTDIDNYGDTAAFLISCVIERKSFENVIRLIGEEFRCIQDKGLSEPEIARVVSMLTAQLEMEIDSLNARLWRLLETELETGKYISTYEVIQNINSIGVRDIQRFVSRWCQSSDSLLVVGGNVAGLEVNSAAIGCKGSGN